MAHESSILPNISSVLTSADTKKREEFHVIKQENPDFYETMDVVKEVLFRFFHPLPLC